MNNGEHSETPGLEPVPSLPASPGPEQQADPTAQLLENSKAKTKASFSAIVDDEGIMRMELNMNDAVESEDKRMILYTFMTEMRDRMMALVFQKRASQAEQRAKLVSLQNKNGFLGFINKISGRR